MLHCEQYVSQSFHINAFTLKVTALDSQAEAAGLRKGDLVLSVNGRSVEGLADYVGAVRRARVGDRLRVRIRRFTSAGQTEQDVSVPLKQFTYVGFTKGASPAYWWLLGFRIATPIRCMALRFWVAAVRVYDRAAWNLLFIMLSVANLIQDGRTAEDALQPFSPVSARGSFALAQSHWLTSASLSRSRLRSTGIVGCVANSEGTAKRLRILRVAKQRRDQR